MKHPLTLGFSVAVTLACASPHAPAWAQPATAVSVDALVLALPQVQTIVGNDLELADEPDFDLHAPDTGMHHNDAQYPAACQVIFDQDAVFTSGWSQFRTVHYTGSANRAVTQAVGIYLTPDSARAVFDNVASRLSQCANAHVPDFLFTVGRPDASTVARCSDGVCNQVFRIKGSTLINVYAVMDNSQQVARAALNAITAKVPG
jgi:hypothetical protein